MRDKAAALKLLLDWGMQAVMLLCIKPSCDCAGLCPTALLP